MNAYAGRVARVNITSGKCSVEESAILAHRFLGGRGVNSWILLNESASDVDPLSPANMPVFGASALVGTMAPAACFTETHGWGQKRPVSKPEMVYCGWP